MTIGWGQTYNGATDFDAGPLSNERGVVHENIGNSYAADSLKVGLPVERDPYSQDLRDYFTAEAFLSGPYGTNQPTYWYDAANNNTYFTFQGRDRRQHAITLDHDETDPDFQWKNEGAGWQDSLINKSDAHGLGAIIQADDGHILLVGGNHSNIGDNPIYKVSRSVNPNDTSSFGPDIDLGTSLTYVKLFKNTDGTIFIFTRNSSSNDYKYYKSTDNGQTWSGEQSAIDDTNTVYIDCAPAQFTDPSDGKLKFYIAFTVTSGGPGIDRANIGFTIFDPSDETFESIQGDDNSGRTDLSETNVKLYDSGTKYVYIPNVLVDSNGRPWIIFNEYDQAGTGESHCRYMYWDDGASAWQGPINIKRIDTANDIEGALVFHGACIDSSDTIHLYLVTQDNAGQLGGVIEYWTRDASNLAGSWTQQNANFLDPANFADGAWPFYSVHVDSRGQFHNDAKIYSSQRVEYGNGEFGWGKAFAYGDSGFVQRKYQHLRGMYLLDETSAPIIDHAGDVGDFSAISAGTHGQTGPLGTQAVAFSSSSYELADHYGWSNTYTVVALAIKNSDHGGTIISNKGGSSELFGHAPIQFDGANVRQYYFENSQDADTFVSASTSAAANGDWGFYFARMAQGDTALSVDGGTSATNSTTNGVSVTSEPARLGEQVDGGNVLDGSIGLLAVWDEPLSNTARDNLYKTFDTTVGVINGTWTSDWKEGAPPSDGIVSVLLNGTKNANDVVNVTLEEDTTGDGAADNTASASDVAYGSSFTFSGFSTNTGVKTKWRIKIEKDIRDITRNITTTSLSLENVSTTTTGSTVTDTALITSATTSSLIATETATATDTATITSAAASPLTATETAVASDTAQITAVSATPLTATATASATDTAQITSAFATPLTASETTSAAVTDTAVITSASATPLTAVETAIANDTAVITNAIVTTLVASTNTGSLVSATSTAQLTLSAPGSQTITPLGALAYITPDAGSRLVTPNATGSQSVTPDTPGSATVTPRAD